MPRSATWIATRRSYSRSEGVDRLYLHESAPTAFVPFVRFGPGAPTALTCGNTPMWFMVVEKPACDSLGSRLRRSAGDPWQRRSCSSASRAPGEYLRHRPLALALLTRRGGAPLGPAWQFRAQRPSSARPAGGVAESDLLLAALLVGGRLVRARASQSNNDGGTGVVRPTTGKAFQNPPPP
jgi:hypothetical protein